MRRSAGFTLIELVIVIVILGILGAVAAPKLFNLQGDAYKANVNALKGSIQSAMTLANTKAVLGGFDTEKEKTVKASDFKTDADTPADDGSTVTFVYGFPAATKGGIISALQDVASFDDVSGSTSTYVIKTTSTTLMISPRARNSSTCQVKYTTATRTAPASVSSVDTGC